MATTEAAARARGAAVNGGVPEVMVRGIRDRPTGWTSWLTTTDHKRIGLLSPRI